MILNRYAENCRIYCSLVSALAAADSILILVLSTSTDTSSYQAPHHQQQPRQHQSVYGSGLGPSEVKDMLALVPPDLATVQRERAQGRCPHMVLMLLRDRESVLHQYPFESLTTHAHPSASASTSRGRSGGRGLNIQSEEPRQQQNIDDYNNDYDEEEGEEYREFAVLCIEETPLEQHYDPTNHPSGRVDLQVNRSTL
jgi:hypothetical protein